MAELLFYALSALALAGGVGVIAARSPMASLLSLLGTFVCLAGVYLLAGFPFLAAAQLLVYAGAIMVLFLFVIMLLNLDGPEARERSPLEWLGRPRVAFAGIAAAGLALAGIAAASLDPVAAAAPGLAAPESGIDDLGAIAALLFSRYLLPFEAASLLLLATMVAVIVLAKRERAARRDEKGNGLSLGDTAPPPQRSPDTGEEAA